MSKPLSAQMFIERAKKIHNNKYDYSKVEYTNNRTKVCIICPEHGEFWQRPDKHLKGQGCPQCGGTIKSNTELFIEKAKGIHGEKYNYSKVNYTTAHEKVCIICPEHGEFWQTPHNHLKGQGCPKCANHVEISKEEFLKRAKKVHGDKYDYSKINYINFTTEVEIICPIHGSFWQKPVYHIHNRGCPICGNKSIGKKLSMGKDEFIEKAKKIHGDKYDYSKVEYKNQLEKVCIICPEHGEFWQSPGNHLSGEGCPTCGNGNHSSKMELEINDFINSLGIKTETSVRSILDDGYEIDIFIPLFKIGIECDGLYWHSEKFKDNSYHLNKTKECFEKGIRLIHIFEDEWIYKRPILESMLKNLFNLTNNKIYARKCEIKDVKNTSKNNFLDENHIQGKCQSSANLGLYYNDELVSLMTFGKPRINMGGKNNGNDWELIRFCSKLNTNIIGGASKLLKEFIKKYNPDSIITYADKKWSLGNLYEKLGFVHDHDSSPNYFYVIENHRENRFKYRKSELIKEGYDKDLSEHQIMLNRGIYRIYDCGCKVYKLNLNKKGES